MRFGDTLIFDTGKDGGPKSRVDGFWLFRSKKLFTVALLRFDRGSREAFHSHAFNSVSWLLTGGLREVVKDYGIESPPSGELVKLHWPSLRPILTRRSTLHKVYGLAKTNWVLTFRGPWVDTWQEIDESGDLVTLTHDRVEMDRSAA